MKLRLSKQPPSVSRSCVSLDMINPCVLTSNWLLTIRSVVNTALCVQIIASYFMTVPLRDEMGVLLGTSTLPKLVGSSVLLSMVCQAATSSLLDTRNHASITKAAALRTFFRRLSLCIFVFAIAVIITVDLPPTAYLDGSNSVMHMGRALFQTPDYQVTTTAEVPPPPPQPPENYTPPVVTEHQFSVVSGDATLSQPRKILFIVFYLWMGIQNLLAGSVMWARCADVFSATSAPRVFGVIAAAATLGQLLGALVVQFLCRSVSGRMPICTPLSSLPATATYCSIQFT